jgi:hypothetical protein
VDQRQLLVESGLTFEQYLLLCAALRPTDDALRAWQLWRDRVDVQRIDRGSTRLLPLLWHNLVAMGVSDPLMPRLRGIYRHTWFSNQGRLAQLVQVRDALAEVDVEMVVLKGVALAYGAYPNPGLRPMDDLDLMVRPVDVKRALGVLEGRGWMAPVADPVSHLEVINGTEFRNAAGDRLDLHAHLLPVGLRADRDAHRWQRTRELDANGSRVRVLDPADQLLQVCVHGALSVPPAIRWVADAMAIITQSTAAIDWQRMAEDAEEEGYGPTLDKQLRVLAGLFDVPVPSAVLYSLARITRTFAARVNHRLATGTQLFLVGGVLQRRAEFDRWKRGPGRDGISFRRYLQLVWDVDDSRAMPRSVMSKAAKRLRTDVLRAPLTAHNPARDG